MLPGGTFPCSSSSSVAVAACPHVVATAGLWRPGVALCRRLRGGGPPLRLLLPSFASRPLAAMAGGGGGGGSRKKPAKNGEKDGMLDARQRTIGSFFGGRDAKPEPQRKINAYFNQGQKQQIAAATETSLPSETTSNATGAAEAPASPQVEMPEDRIAESASELATAAATPSPPRAGGSGRRRASRKSEASGLVDNTAATAAVGEEPASPASPKRARRASSPSTSSPKASTRRRSSPVRKQEAAAPVDIAAEPAASACTTTPPTNKKQRRSSASPSTTSSPGGLAETSSSPARTGEDSVMDVVEPGSAPATSVPASGKKPSRRKSSPPSTQGDQDGAAPKGKRRRLVKALQPAAAAVTAELDEVHDVVKEHADSEVHDAPAGSVEEAASPAPKGRARKAKAKAQVEDSASEVGSEVEDDLQGSEQDEVATEKKVLKPAKAAPKKAKAPRGKATEKTVGIGDGLVGMAAKLLKHDPRELATWKDGEPVPYFFLANAFDEISEETRRLVIQEKMCNVFRTIMVTTPADLLPAVYLTNNTVAPPHEGIELNIGEATVLKALSQSTGSKDATIRAEQQKLGDLGLVARALRSKQKTLAFSKPKPLSIAHVFEEFRAIAAAQGSQSVERKVGKINGLMMAAKDVEAQFIVRQLTGKMRIGLAEQSVVASLGLASVLAEPNLSTKELPDRLDEAMRIMKRANSEMPSYDLIIPALLKYGVRELPKHCQFTLGVPIRPMLAKPTNGVSEVLDKFQDREFTCEYKYDGERAQVHILDNGDVRIYSRNLEDNTGKFPDIVSGIKQHIKPGVKSAVIDAEAVAYDRNEDKILPFQILSTRSRKAVSVESIKVQVCLFAFDCLYLNGESLLQKSLTERREALYGAFTEAHGYFEFAKIMTSRDTDEIMAFMNDAVDASCEGLIIKELTGHSTYEPSRRSNNWLKLKKDYMEGVGDSFDLVVIGAFHGRGKRSGVYGAYLLACYDDENEGYQSLCKVGTGFSEEMLQSLYNGLAPHIIPQPRPYYQFGDSLDVAVWFDPVQVWEIKAADLSISPVHQAAHGKCAPGKGVALRFPRFLRLRDDKNPEDATTADQVAEFYRKQFANKKGGANKAAKQDDDDDW